MRTKEIRRAIKYGNDFQGKIFVIGICQKLDKWEPNELARDIELTHNTGVKMYILCPKELNFAENPYIRYIVSANHSSMVMEYETTEDGDMESAKLAISKDADKLIYVCSSGGIYEEDHLINQLTLDDATKLFNSSQKIGGSVKKKLEAAIYACQNGIRRVHIISARHHKGDSLLKELYTAEGVGTLITSDSYEDKFRPIKRMDWMDIKKIMQENSLGLDDIHFPLKSNQKGWVYTLDDQVFGCIIVRIENGNYHIEYMVADESEELFSVLYALIDHTINEARINKINKLILNYKQTPIWLLLKPEFINYGFTKVGDNGYLEKIISHE